MATVRRVRRVARVVVRVASALVALGVLFVGWLHTSSGGEWLRGRIEARLAPRVTTSVVLGGVDVSLWSGITLRELAVSDRDGVRAIVVRRVHVAPRLKDIVAGTVALDELVVSGVRIEIHGRADGTTNLTGIVRPSDAKRPDHVVVRSLAIEDVSVKLDRPDGLAISTTGLSVRGKLDARPNEGTLRTEVGLRIDRVDAARAGLGLTAEAIALDGVVDLPQKGSGTVRIGPVSGKLRVTREGAPPFDAKLSLPELEVLLTPERLALTLSTFELAAISLAAAKVEAVRAPDGALVAESAKVTRLVLKAGEVEALAGKRLLAGDVTIDVSATTTKGMLTPEVQIHTDGGVVSLRGEVDLSTQDVVRGQITIDAHDLDVNRIYASATLPPLRLGNLHLTMRGERRVNTAPSAQASLALRDVHVRDMDLRRLDATLRLEGGRLVIDALDLEALGQAIHASGSYGLEDKSVDVTIGVNARIGMLLDTLRARGVLARPPSPLVSAIQLGNATSIRITGKAAEAMVVRVQDVDARVAGGQARLAVTANVVRGIPERGEKALVVRGVEATVDLQAISLREIARLQAKALPVGGRVSGRMNLHGGLEAPEGDVHLRVDLEDAELRATGRVELDALVQGRRLSATGKVTDARGESIATVKLTGLREGANLEAIDVVVDASDRALVDLPVLSSAVRSKLPPSARAALHATVKGGPRAAHLDLELRGRLDADSPPIVVAAKADLAGAVSGWRSAPLAWETQIEVPELDLATLPLPLADVRGRVRASGRLRGTREDATGTLSVEGRALGTRQGPPLDARLAIDLAEDATHLHVKSSVAGIPLVEGTVTAEVAGRGLVAKARTGVLAALDPKLDGRLRIPDQTLAAWSSVVAGAQGLPGHAGAELVIGGRARDPSLDLEALFAGYPTLAGPAGAVSVHGHATLDRAKVRVVMNGSTDASNAPVELSLEGSPRQLLDRTPGAVARAHASLTAQAVPLATIAPDVPGVRSLRPEGVLDARLEADLSLRRDGDARTLDELSVRGPLSLTRGAIGLPGTHRRIEDIIVRLMGQGDDVMTLALDARESDRDEPRRSLIARGRYGIRAKEAEAQVTLHRVLVSGAAFGELDAPRAALSAELGVKGSFGGAFRRIEVDVAELELRNPDRQPRAAQQEVGSLGDVLELGPGITVGKLPVPVRGKSLAAIERADKSLDVVLRFPKPVHLEQRPLDLFAKGEIHLERFGERRVLTGELAVERGTLYVGGRPHALSKGAIRMTDEGAMLDLHFQRAPIPAALRDMTAADASNVELHMRGLLGRQKLTVSGKSDVLFDALALEGLGRVRVLSTADAPAGQTPQLPQTPQIRQTAFMSANLPHLAFLDRINAYADPNVGRFAYGRFETLEADRYFASGTRRIRTTVRSRAIGQSDAEVEGSYLFTNTPRTVSGFGVVGGTRVGGGPVVFWEWSSPD